MLSFLPTPIGNLEDISYRAVRILKSAKIIFAEDTRIAKSLLSLLSQRLNIDFGEKTFISLHSHNEIEKLSTIDINLFDEDTIYMSDAGMPAISDPGMHLINYAQSNNIPYDVLPGANAVLTALVMSGMSDKNFYFHGFLPHKPKERIKELKALLNRQEVIVLYESPHRLLQFAQELTLIDPLTPLFLAKELTKKFQSTFKGTAEEVLNLLQEATIKGEWVAVFKPLKSTNLPSNLLDIVAPLPLPPKEAAKLLAKLSQTKVKDCYEALSTYNK
jgi:16S rRNA (cytidine1402-2'-O)-methyltransferase